jgi:hypothetical protein
MRVNIRVLSAQIWKINIDVKNCEKGNQVEGVERQASSVLTQIPNSLAEFAAMCIGS